MPRISWFRPPIDAPLYPLPPAIQRHIFQTPSGHLELLIAHPASRTNPTKKPIFLAHGGCGSAPVWLEYMTFFSQEHNIPCYAVSYRGRGASWYPSFLSLLFTSKETLAEDLATGIQEAARIEAGQRSSLDNRKYESSHAVQMMLVGHSSGGGLGQLILNNGLDLGDAEIVGLALIGSIPCFGNAEVNRNWMSMDPWFLPRMLVHLFHPMSPLSSTRLVAQAFFCPEYPTSKVVEFERSMPHYESLSWPIGMGKRFVDCGRVLRALGVGPTTGSTISNKLFVLAAEKDRLCSVDLMERMAAEYRQAALGTVLLEAKETSTTAVNADHVRFDVLAGAGHHLQNDLQWEKGALKILSFYEQLW